MIPHNAWVILIRDDGTQALVRASKNAEVRSGHIRALGDQLVGHPYGSTFEFHPMTEEENIPIGKEKSLVSLNEKRAKKQKAPIKYSKLVRVEATEDPFAILQGKTAEDAAAAASADDDKLMEGDTRDNRGYFADPTNQKADSVEMRKSGATGHEIVRALAENSKTFAQKNKFSQEKYLKRITAKHVPKITVVRTTSRTVAEVLFIKHQPNLVSDPIRCVRWMDALPQLLGFGNVHAGGKCMVLDGVGGLLSLSVLERLDESLGGRCYFVGTTPREVTGGGGRPFIDLLNIPKNVLISRFVICPAKLMQNGTMLPDTTVYEEDDFYEEDAQQQIEKLLDSSNNNNEDGKNEVDSELSDDDNEDGEEKQKEMDATPAAADDTVPSSKRLKTFTPEFHANRQMRKIRREEMFKVLNVANGGTGADSLLIAARQDPSEALDVLLPHLGLGKPFVVHHPCIEPLMVARAKLAESKAILDLTVTESFCREYQVLPGRTHPTMTGSATGGFILRGIKVQPWL